VSALPLYIPHRPTLVVNRPLSKGSFSSQDLKNDLTSTLNSLKDAVFYRLREPDYQNKNHTISVFIALLYGGMLKPLLDTL
jgi:hypothetical protein